MTVRSSIDPARLLEEQLAQASPDLLRAMPSTFVEALSPSRLTPPAVHGVRRGRATRTLPPRPAAHLAWSRSCRYSNGPAMIETESRPDSDPVGPSAGDVPVSAPPTP